MESSFQSLHCVQRCEIRVPWERGLTKSLVPTRRRIFQVFINYIVSQFLVTLQLTLCCLRTILSDSENRLQMGIHLLNGICKDSGLQISIIKTMLIPILMPILFNTSHLAMLPSLKVIMAS